MLAKITYFTQRPLLIPGAQNVPAIGDYPVQSASLVDFMEVCEEELLINILGIEIYEDLMVYVDIDGILPTAPQKYLDLVNGNQYLLNDRTFQYKGLLGNNGILANYIFCKWLESDLSTYTTVGIQASKAENSERVSAIPTWINAWRTFIKIYQQDAGRFPNVFQTHGAIGIDWYGQGDLNVSLYRFLEDSEDFNTDYFKYEENENRFGI